MIRTILLLGVFAILGVFVLRFAFGIFGVLIALLIWLLILALKVAILGVIIYLAIRIFSPDTARRIRQKLSGPETL